MLLSLNIGIATVSLATKVLLALLNHFSTALILSSQAPLNQVNMARCQTESRETNRATLSQILFRELKDFFRPERSEFE